MLHSVYEVRIKIGKKAQQKGMRRKRKIEV